VNRSTYTLVMRELETQLAEANKRIAEGAKALKT
jgi:hypothetical protein